MVEFVKMIYNWVDKDIRPVAILCIISGCFGWTIMTIAFKAEVDFTMSTTEMKLRIAEIQPELDQISGALLADVKNIDLLTKQKILQNKLAVYIASIKSLDLPHTRYFVGGAFVASLCFLAFICTGCTIVIFYLIFKPLTKKKSVN